MWGMSWFGLQKFATSNARWLGSFFARSGWIFLTPPFLQHQILIKTYPFSILHIRIKTYNDWAAVYKVFRRLEYSTRRFLADGEVRQTYEEILTAGKSPLIVDLGAHIGISSCWFATEFGLAKIIGLEPSNSNFQLAGTNTEAFQNIEIHHAAIAATNEPVSLFDPGLGNDAFRTFSDSGLPLETVAGWTMSHLLALNPDSTPFIAKIDIEGFEKFLFDKDCEWIDEFKVVVVETHDWLIPGKAISAGLLSSLGSRNRDFLMMGEHVFSIRN